MLLREKLLVMLAVLISLIGVADLSTPHVNKFWEKYFGFSGRFLITQKEKIGYVNARSRLIIRPKFDQGVSYFNQDPAPVMVDGKWGFVDAQGSWVIPPRFTTAAPFYEGMAAVGHKTPKMHSVKFGFVNTKGEFLVDALYSEAGNFVEGLAPVKKAGLWGFINASGAVVIPLQFEQAQSFSDGLAAVKRDGLWGYVDSSGLPVIKPQFEDAKSFHQGRAPVKINGRWGYVDHIGRWIIEPKFMTAGIFSDGMAPIDDSGYIDREGNIVVAAGTFGHAHEFSEGLAAVQEAVIDKAKTGLWGYIDARGQWVIQPRFELAKDFQGGLARVSKDKNSLQRGYVHKNGRLVWDPADWEMSAAFMSFWKAVAMVGAGIVPLYIFGVLRARQRQYYYHQTIA